MSKKIDVVNMVQKKRALIAKRVQALKENEHITPKFVVLLVGENPASLSYIKGKTEAAHEVGMQAELLQLPETTSEAMLLREIERLNNDVSVHGFIVQLPLPKHINQERIFTAISLLKDIDGLHPDNLGRLLLGVPRFEPCTPKGIMHILDESAIELRGKHVVVVGRSDIVGKPVALLALARDATVTVCHSKTLNLPQVTQLADILIVAIGREEFIDATYVKAGAIVIDVGINTSTKTGKLVGDVDYEAVKDVVHAITPVPRGVGPMTITMLLENTLQAVFLQRQIKS